jgi:sec-independent protein translocase protein TatB
VLNLDPSKLLIIAVVAVILLGPDKLPQVARQVGSAWRSFGEFRHRMESEVRSSIPDLPSSADIARLARSPSALLNHLSNMAPDRDQETDLDGGQDGAEGGVDGVPTSADSSGDEQPVPPPPGGSDTPSGLNGSPYTPTDPMPPTPTTRSQPAPPAPGPFSGPADGDPGLN